MLTKAWARETMPPGESQIEWLYQKGSTNNIISAIGYADERSAPFTERFAKALEGMSKYDVARNIWYFLKNNIRYKEDPKGYQFVKSPAQLVTSGVGDCKSFAVFTGSVLQNLGIPYRYKFTAYFDPEDPDNKDVKHVYVVVPDGSNNIIIDAVFDRFNSEKKPIKVEMILTPNRYMAAIAYIRGFGNEKKIGCGCSHGAKVGNVPGVKKAVTHFAVSAIMVGTAMVLSK